MPSGLITPLFCVELVSHVNTLNFFRAFPFISKNCIFHACCSFQNVVQGYAKVRVQVPSDCYFWEFCFWRDWFEVLDLFQV